MHIAICDDNVADRKQLERLLTRESDKRKSTSGVFYVDSFGHCHSLRQNPMQYTLFFIDLTAEAPDGLTFAVQLIQAGVTAPIVLCSSKINYLEEMKELSLSSSELMHLQKPIKSAELSAILNQAVILQSSLVPTIELRSEKETRYVLENDIIYAISHDRYIQVALSDGTCMVLLTDLLNFYDQLPNHPHLVLLTEHAMININYMRKYSPFWVTLKDGTKVKSSPLAVKYIKIALKLTGLQ